MYALVQIVGMAANTLSMIIMVWFVLGLLFAFNIIGRDQQFLVQVERSIAALLEPLLGPIRRRLPDTGAIDFSPMVLILGINAVMMILGSVG